MAFCICQATTTFSDAGVLSNSTFFQFIIKMAPTQQTQPNYITQINMLMWYKK